MSNIPQGPYDPIQTEEKILRFWLDNSLYKPEYDPVADKVVSVEEMKKSNKETYCNINPPPNAYGRPHLGNISGYAYQDLLGRYNRMKGKMVLLQPGKDHAGIQGEIVVLREYFKPQNKSKSNMSRDEFYNETYSYFTKMMDLAMEDEKRIGLSADYDRNVFTLDPDIVKTVLETFIMMHNDGHVYKGVRIVNWCPSCQTALADIDTEKKDYNTKFVYIKYPVLSDEGTKTGEYIMVATTRPETMLGDTAVAVNPKDERYKNYIGKKVMVPLVDRVIPVITDEMVDKEFGTGAVKVTPAHSPADYAIMLRWNNINPDKKIDYINVIDKNAIMVGPVGIYKGQSTNECAINVISDLEKLGLIDRIEEMEHTVSVCERCKTIIEPIMSSQWFVKVDDLKQKAIEVVEKDEVIIHPKYLKKRYLHWMNNLRDWPISRSLWWGYRVPAWYKGAVTEMTDENGKIINKIGDIAVGDFNDAVNKGVAKLSLDSPGEDWFQDDDVFDTWFSSGQWPYATLIRNNLLDKFFPTDLMETGYDILEFWVSRMIMFSLYRFGEIPFKDVYLHGMVQGTDGQKMSKSKGNVVPFDDLINEYGADALRLLYITGNKAGASYRIDRRKLEGYKKFLNKIWNATKFILNSVSDFEDIAEIDREKLKFEEIDSKMITAVEQLAVQVGKAIENFKFGLVALDLQQSFWHDFCDVYIEAVKNRLYTKDREGNSIAYNVDSRRASQWTLWYCIRIYLQLLHPYIPFITEELWAYLPKIKGENKSIMYSKFPSVLN